MQLVGVAQLGPGLLAHARDRLGVELAEVARRSPGPASGAPSRPACGAPRAARRRGRRTAARSRISCASGEGSVRSRATTSTSPASMRASSRSSPSMSIASCRQSCDRLPHQRVIGDLAVADDVLAAGELIREDRREQVLGRHALQLRRRPCARRACAAARAPRIAFQRQRAPNIGASSSACDEQRPHRLRRQIARHVGERKAVRAAEREHDRVLGRRRLQLEVERAAEALAQRQAPGAVDAAAEGRVDDELHAARLVEEALEHHVVAGSAARRAPPAPRAGSRRSARPRRARAPSARVSQPSAAARPPASSARGDRLAQPRHRGRQLVAARRAPRRARTACSAAGPCASSTRTRAALDAQDALGGVAELEDVAGQALDREVLVQGADQLRLRLEHAPW